MNKGRACDLELNPQASFYIHPYKRVVVSEDVLKPFNRGATGSTDGYGLGLAIVQRIAEWHGASLQLDRCTLLGGANFILEFPARRA